MTTEQQFLELGISPFIIVNLMENLDLSPEHLNDPHVFRKLQHVIDFLKTYSENDQRFLVRKATLGKQDKLKTLHEYVDILKEKKFYESVHDKINSERSSVESTGDLQKLQELTEQEIRNDLQLKQINEELDIYHK